MAGPLLAVDAPSLLYRAFHALPSSIKGADGRPVNALLGCANQVLWAVERHKPRAVVLCFGAEAAVYRTELYPPYHSDRPPMPEELVHQWERGPDFFEALGWTVLGHDTLEADDLLGSLATVEVQAGGTAVLFTGDRDMFQCVGKNVVVLFPRRQGRPDRDRRQGRARALQGRPRAGARLHRPARRPLRRAAGSARHRREGSRRAAARPRDAGAGDRKRGQGTAARGGRAARPGRRAAVVQGDRNARPRAGGTTPRSAHGLGERGRCGGAIWGWGAWLHALEAIAGQR